MRDKEYNFQKKRIQKLIKKWVGPLGLRWYRLKFNYHDVPNMEESDYEPKSIDGMWETAMATCADHNYCTASIDFYLPTIAKIKDDDEVEEYFIHELMHIFLRPMHSKETAAQEELVATKLAQAFFWVTKKGKL